ncbi:MAG TPA: 4Fe-4S dicluster domain-containing protein, partial [Rhodobacteraceae bacterium]|nr:4Fe-4S dicluster domain-containing protein [Paracoccaceae bacterium]
GINAVEQYVGDWANENGVKLAEAGADTGFKIAVIGGGPAGLAAAYFMRQDGHAVTVFEANGKLGGMMRYGIPGYRTPRDMLDIEIGRITEMGVDVKLNTKVGVDVSVASLEEEYDAIFWALGAQKGRPLPIPGWEGTENCIDGVEFLDAFNKGWVVGTAQKVVVVGGGDTSIDVASVARRLGHVTNVAKTEHSDGSVIDFTAQDAAGVLTREGMQATLTSLFPIEQMTAAEHEREDAKREGVDIKGSVMPLEVILNDQGRATGLRMCECEMKGNAPVAIEGTEFVIEADIIIAAIGQAGDFEGIEGLGNERGFIDIEAGYKVKGKDKHFAGGDILKPHLLTTAIGHGRVAAETISDYLDDGIIGKRPKIDIASFNLLEELHERGHDPSPYEHLGGQRGTDTENYAVHNYEDRSDGQIVKHTELYKGHFPYVAREVRDEVHIEGDNVLGNFEERIIAYSEEQAQKEGERCMSCGMCFECDNCVIYCPQDAVSRVKKNDRTLGRYVETDYGKCIGCHICADVCPTGYIQMGLGG